MDILEAAERWATPLHFREIFLEFWLLYLVLSGNSIDIGHKRRRKGDTALLVRHNSNG